MNWADRVRFYITESKTCEICGKLGKKVIDEEDPIFKPGKQKKVRICTKCYYKRLQGG